MANSHRLDKKINVYVVKTSANFDFMSYLDYFAPQIQLTILEYRFQRDQITKFTSELLKYYYLAKVANTSPCNIKISYNEYKKPAVNDLCLQFNISHSKDYVVIVSSSEPNISIGVDIEYIDNSVNYVELMPLVFSDFEQQQVNTVTEFYQLWTKKEALIKAYGSGFISDYYRNTQLTLDEINELENYLIYTTPFKEDYCMSVCVSKNINLN